LRTFGVVEKVGMSFGESPETLAIIGKTEAGLWVEHKVYGVTDMITLSEKGG
jgi:hypothetical protein